MRLIHQQFIVVCAPALVRLSVIARFDWLLQDDNFQAELDETNYGTVACLQYR